MDRACLRLAFAMLLSACADPASSSDGGGSGDGSSSGAPPAASSSSTSAGDVTLECPRLVRYPMPSSAACDRVAVGDIDGDGIDDLVASYGVRFIEPASVSLATYLADADGLGTPVLFGPITVGGETLALFDVNGDEVRDLVYTSVVEPGLGCGDVVPRPTPDVASRLWGPEGGWVVEAHTAGLPTPPFGSGTSLVVGDSTVVLDRFGSFVPLTTNGTGLELDPAQWIDFDTAVDMVVGPIDGEPGDEVIVLSADRLTLWHPTPDGLVEGAFVPWPGLPGRLLPLADVDADGHLDVIVEAADGLAWFRGDGDGVPSSPVALHPGGDSNLLVTPGPDARVIARVGPELVWYPVADPDGTAHPIAAYGELGGHADMGDLDGDGDVDLAWCDADGLLVAYF